MPCCWCVASLWVRFMFRIHLIHKGLNLFSALYGCFWLSIVNMFEYRVHRRLTNGSLFDWVWVYVDFQPVIFASFLPIPHYTQSFCVFDGRHGHHTAILVSNSNYRRNWLHWIYQKVRFFAFNSPIIKRRNWRFCSKIMRLIGHELSINSVHSCCNG